MRKSKKAQNTRKRCWPAFERKMGEEKEKKKVDKQSRNSGLLTGTALVSRILGVKIIISLMG